MPMPELPTRRQLRHLRRHLASLMLWTSFGVGGLAISLIVFPTLLLIPVPQRIRRRWAMTLVHWGFASIIAGCRWFGVVDVRVEGGERLRKLGRAIVIANHPSYLDVVVLLATMPRACCIVTSRHWRNPIFAGIVRSAGYLRNDGGPSLVIASEAALADDVPLIVFPEGTRSPSRGQLGKFSRGFAHIALAHRCPIVPVLIDCDPPAYTKQHRWYTVTEQMPVLRVLAADGPFFDTIDATNTSDATGPADVAASATPMPATPVAPVAARHLTVHAERYFSDQISRHGLTRT